MEGRIQLALAHWPAIVRKARNRPELPTARRVPRTRVLLSYSHLIPTHWTRFWLSSAKCRISLNMATRRSTRLSTAAANAPVADAFEGELSDKSSAKKHLYQRSKLLLARASGVALRIL